MFRCSRSLALLAVFAIAVWFAGSGPAQAAKVVTVAVSPGVVPVGALPAVKSSLLVTATISGVPAGTADACTVTVVLQPSGTILATKPVSTSPAPASGVTSLSTLFTISGGTGAGLAQAVVNCGGNSGSVLFRISALVALNASPLSVPAGGALTLNLLIATNGALPLPAQCTIAVTDPAGSAPPLAFQSLTVSGGSASAPAQASVTITLPSVAPIGPANAAASCVIQGIGTAGDSVDFVVTDPSQVTLVAPVQSAAPGTTLVLSAITLPGFACVAELTLPDGERLSSANVTAGMTGAASLTLLVPASAQPGSASLVVVCTDPTNPANSATSAAQPIAVAVSQPAPAPAPAPAAAPLSLAPALVNTAQPLAPGGLVTLAVTTTPAALCSVGGLLGADGSDQTIGEPSAAGTAGANGTVTLSFHLPAGSPSGTSIMDVGCTSGGAQANAQIPLHVGVAAACGDLNSGSAAATSLGTAPLANAGAPYASSVGEPIQFSARGSQPSAGSLLTSCRWDFGDGQTADGLAATHTYTAAGMYRVTLSVSDSSGLSASAATTASVGGFMPLCAQPALNGRAGLTACVTDLSCPATSLPGRCLPPCASYMPIALPSQSPCPQPTMTARISMGGPYSSQLFQPVQFQASVTVNGTRRLCSADASLGTAGPFCRLVPAVTLPQPVSYDWDFGDGSTANGAGAVHAYATLGSYAVKLEVTFDDGSTANATTQAQVTGLPPREQLALTSGCNSVSLRLTGAVPSSVVASWVSAARVTALWAMRPGQAALAWFPDAGTPQDLAAVGAGETIWLCVDGPGVLTLPS